MIASRDSYFRPMLMVLGLLVCLQSPLPARSAWWKPERVPGSAQLSVESIRYLVLAESPSAPLSAAADDFLDVMERRGMKLTLLGPEVDRFPKEAIFLIRDQEQGMRGGFSIRRNRSRIFLRAASDNGIVNGLYAICRETLGARWYWAGDLGFEFAGKAEDKFPDRAWREQPAFDQRALYPVASDFGRRNLLNRTYSFNHNLARIFTGDIYDTSPEVFAEIGGQRQRPKGSPKYDPQPDFTHPETVELAVETVRRHFVDHPESTSFSLSINDNSLFDEGSETEAIVSPLSYFRGRPNYTDLVFGFMNAVAEEVFSDREILQTPAGEGRYLTALAYYWTEQSPGFEIHPRVMPVLTSDRAQWHDPEYRAGDKALIGRWANSGAERIATWDYYFGSPYPYPRQFTQWMVESIKFLHEKGVDVFFSQLPSVWGLDGPKAWLATQLLWDPNQDAGDLLDEFYTNFFGPASEPIREFYEIAEETRNQLEGEAEWIKFYSDEAGIELFDADTLAQMRDCIRRAEQVVASAKASRFDIYEEPRPERFKERVQVVSEAFSFTQMYAGYHRSRVELLESGMAVFRGETPIFNGDRMVQLLEKNLSNKAEFVELYDRLVQNPLHAGLSRFMRIMQSDPLPLALAALARLDLSNENIEELASFPSFQNINPDDFRFVRSGKNHELKHSGTEVRNFLGPEVPVIDAWNIQYRASEGLRLFAASGQEAAGLRIENADTVSIGQAFPVLAERNYLLRIEAAWRVSPDNRIRVQLNWVSLAGENLQTEIILRIPGGESRGLQAMEFALTSPVNAYDLQVRIVANRQYEGDYLEIKRVELGQFFPKH